MPACLAAAEILLTAPEASSSLACSTLTKTSGRTSASTSRKRLSAIVYPPCVQLFSMCPIIPRARPGCKPFAAVFVQFVKLHSPQRGKVDIFCASTTVADTKTHHPNRVRFEWCAFLCCAVGAGHVRPCRVRQTYAYGKAAGRACPAPTWEAAFYSVGSVVVSPAAAAASAAAWARAA